MTVQAWRSTMSATLFKKKFNFFDIMYMIRSFTSVCGSSMLALLIVIEIFVCYKVGVMGLHYEDEFFPLAKSNLSILWEQRAYFNAQIFQSLTLSYIQALCICIVKSAYYVAITGVATIFSVFAFYRLYTLLAEIMKKMVNPNSHSG